MIVRLPAPELFIQFTFAIAVVGVQVLPDVEPFSRQPIHYRIPVERGVDAIFPRDRVVVIRSEELPTYWFTRAADEFERRLTVPLLAPQGERF